MALSKNEHGLTSLTEFPMSEPSFSRIQELFLESLEIAEDQREAWLADQCGDDVPLRQRVLELMRQDARADDPLEEGLLNILTTVGPKTNTKEDSSQIDSEFTVRDSLQLVEKLSEVGILSGDEAAALHDCVSNGSEEREPEKLVAKLVSSGKLTEYQASALLKGRPDLLLDKYLILDLIGAGGMGMVFKALHRTMNRVVAIKMISQNLLSSPELVKRFQREVRVAATLEHPNIVRAYDADQAKGVHFLVLEYVRGENLAETVKREGPLSLSKAVDAIVQAARGLDHAHEHGIVHRDVKPGNLMRNSDGAVKVLDMGLANVDESFRIAQISSVAMSRDFAEGDVESQGFDLTQAGTVLGTVSYMAPEQSLKADAADARSDVYALGCSLYYLLTGEPPYSGETVFDVFAQHRDGKIPSLREQRPDVPVAVDAVCRRMLAKSPTDRQQSMQDVISALQACEVPAPKYSKNRSPARPKAQSTQTRRDETTTLASNRRPSWVTLALLLLVLVGGGYGVAQLLGPWLNGDRNEGGKPLADAKQPDSATLVHELGTANSTKEGNFRSEFALQFNGDGDYVELPAMGFRGDQAVTLEAWYESDELMRGVETCLFLLDRCIWLEATRKGAWRVVGNAGERDYFRSNLMEEQTIGRPVHLAVVFDGSNFSVFVDGRQKQLEHLRYFRGETDWQKVPRLGDLRLEKKALRIDSALGKHPGPLKGQTFAGRIYSVRYSRGERYTEDFIPTRRLEKDDDTFALYQFDEGKGEVLHDTSGNNHHGKIVGAEWIQHDAYNPTIMPANIDLLAETALDQAVIRNDDRRFRWTKYDDKISVTPGTPDGAARQGRTSIEFPREIGGDYFLTMELTPGNHGQYLVSLPLGDRRVDLSLRTTPGNKRPYVSGLSLSDTSIVTEVPSQLVLGQRNRLTVSVVQAVENVSIDAKLNGADIASYFGRRDVLYAIPFLQEFGNKRLGLHCCNSRRLVIHNATLTPLTAADLLASGEWEWRVVEKLAVPLREGEYLEGVDLTADGLELVYASKREGGYGGVDLWTSRRDSKVAAWDAPRNLGPKVNAERWEKTPALSPDGLLLVYSGGNEGREGVAKIRTRSRRESTWSSPPSFPIDSGFPRSYTDFDVPSGSRHFAAGKFFADRRIDIFLSSRKSATDPWPNPTRLSEAVNSEEYEIGINVSSDGRMLIFSRHPDGGSPYTAWVSWRNGPDGDDWEEAVPIKAVNEMQGKTMRLLPDDRSLIFTSNAEDGRNGIFIARLVRKEAPQVPIKGLPSDQAHGDVDQNEITSKPELEPVSKWEVRDMETLPLENSSGADLTADRKMAIFSHDFDLWIATRPDLDRAWSDPVKLDLSIESGETRTGCQDSSCTRRLGLGYVVELGKRNSQSSIKRSVGIDRSCKFPMFL